LDITAQAERGGYKTLGDYYGSGYAATGNSYLFPEDAIVPDDTQYMLFTVHAGTGYLRWGDKQASATNGHPYTVGKWVISGNASELRKIRIYDSAGTFTCFATFYRP
jgi:hypothetical protein